MLQYTVHEEQKKTRNKTVKTGDIYMRREIARRIATRFYGWVKIALATWQYCQTDTGVHEGNTYIVEEESDLRSDVDEVPRPEIVLCRVTKQFDKCSQSSPWVRPVDDEPFQKDLGQYLSEALILYF